MRIPVLCALVLASLSGVVSAHAATFNFASGVNGFTAFVNDNDIRLLPFTVTDSFARVSVSTDSYANLDGFDPTLALYTSTGNAATDLFYLGDTGGFSADKNNALGLYDDVMTVVVPAGNYVLALTQHDNTATETDNDAAGILTRADGFVFNNPTFSLPNYTGGPFVDLDGNANTGAWRVAVSTVAVPEAGSFALLAPAIALLGVALRRRTIAQKGN